ncbi:kinase-like domain-containing protein, partial [Papiliotrema laurentii]
MDTAGDETHSCKPLLSASQTAPSSPVTTESRPVKRVGAVRLEDFELIRVLGKGCAGRVLLVRETATNSVLAMKAISKRSVLTHCELHHTLAELNILRRFAIEEPENPFVAKLHHSFTDRENFYFVMEFYPGGDLATQMEIHGVLGHHRTRFYAADIVQGIEDLHRHGIIIRDLKPENILLNARGHAVLADFGLSKDFGYRGEPRPLHVVTYPGQPSLPDWAGKGAGSLRVTALGAKKLVVDRAFSFVGTSEYLAPEVVKRGEYSYAVDWWALGCIVLEGMIGRAPFRTEDDEPPIVLWNKILNDNWDNIFLDPIMRGRDPGYYHLDHVTWDFIDALLIKDPMWRLTEPCVKSHPYFQYIDWETVRRGEYEDPYDLQLHPVSEYNTYYFPKLCLDEEPTVDMTSHDYAYHGHAAGMADNVRYMLEQAKFKEELESFTWSRNME